MNNSRNSKTSSRIPSGRRLTVETLEPREMLSGQGLSAQYFHNVDLTGLAVERTEAVDFAWGVVAPAPGVDPETFSVRWTGQVEALYTETYTFRTVSDEGVRLWVDGQLLIDRWDAHTAQVDSGTIDLVAGQRYDIRLEYYDDTGSAQIRLQWSSASQVLEAIPASQLHTSPGGLLGQYTDDSANSVTQVEATIDFDWGTGSPVAPITSDDFQVSYTGMLRVDYGEEYTFSVDSAGLTRLWVDNDLIIDNWTEHTTTTDTGTKTLEPGKWYDVRLDFEDESGTAEVSLGWSSPSQTGGGTVAMIPTENLLAAQSTRLAFTNSLGPGQDPYVVQWNDKYLLIRSEGNTVRINQAEQLQDIHQSNPASSEVIAWTAPGGTNYSQQIWAPELHRLDGKWYIYVAASDGNNATHRMHVLERDSADPFGPYVYKGEISAATNRWAIDGTVLSWQGVNYFVWSGWPGFVDGQQNLYIAQMSNPWTLATDRVLISSPQFSWEMFGLDINEGPQVLIDDGNLHIIYSGSAFWTPEYALGRLTYDGSGSLLDPANWVKEPNPVFSKTTEVVGVGHASFTKSPDGTEDWIVFHAHNNPNVFNDDRVVHIQPFDFASDGTPDFGIPLPLTTVIDTPSPSRAPSTEPTLLEGDFDSSDSVDSSDLDVWTEQYGVSLFPGSSADASGNGRADGFDFLEWQRNVGKDVVTESTVAYWRHEEGTDGGFIPSGNDTVLDESGNNHMRTFDPSFTSATYSTSVSPLALREGTANSLSLDFGPGGDDAGLNDDNFSIGKPIESQLFNEMTVEFAFSMNSIGGFQTLVGKDGQPTGSPVAPLQIKVRGDNFPDAIDNQLFVEWIDGDGDVHFLSSGFTAAASTWYHVAFLLTETSADLYIAGESGDYILVDSIAGADFAGSSDEVLFDSTGSFTVGRGMFSGTNADWSDALIDEVRISNRALDKSHFLFEPNTSPVLTLSPDSQANLSSESEEDALVLVQEKARETFVDQSTTTPVETFSLVQYPFAVLGLPTGATISPPAADTVLTSQYSENTSMSETTLLPWDLALADGSSIEMEAIDDVFAGDIVSDNSGITDDLGSEGSSTDLVSPDWDTRFGSNLG